MQIDLATQFSPYPSGRYPTDGKFNGQTFREEVLVPALKGASAADKLFINIDGVRTFGSSFLEEAFGGIVRNGELSREELKQRLEVVCTKAHLRIFKDSILTYIENAKPAAMMHA